ncbi:hypothetical protein QZH41_004121 [Actinostola sp. cb2023]|nr:hypothetical protein QZH41_004121 [Actinostola sp. cb2023]
MEPNLFSRADFLISTLRAHHFCRTGKAIAVLIKGKNDARCARDFVLTRAQKLADAAGGSIQLNGDRGVDDAETVQPIPGPSEHQSSAYITAVFHEVVEMPSPKEPNEAATARTEVKEVPQDALDKVVEMFSRKEPNEAATARTEVEEVPQDALDKVVEMSSSKEPNEAANASTEVEEVPQDALDKVVEMSSRKEPNEAATARTEVEEVPQHALDKVVEISSRKEPNEAATARTEVEEVPQDALDEVVEVLGPEAGNKTRKKRPLLSTGKCPVCGEHRKHLRAHLATNKPGHAWTKDTSSGSS